MRILMIIAALLLHINTLHAASPVAFRQMRASDGLADNQIEGVFIFPDGRLGIRTPALMSIYDGYRVENHPYDNHRLYEWTNPGIPITQYIDSAHGLVWLKGRNVLRAFDYRRDGFVENIDSLLKTHGVDFPLANLFIDHDGRHWYVSSTGKVSTLEDGKATVAEFISPRAAKGSQIIHIDGKGDDIIVVYGGGKVIVYDLKSKRVKAQYDDFSGRINAEDRVLTRIDDSGGISMIWDKGYAHLGGGNGKWTMPGIPLKDEKDVFTCIDLDQEGNAYIGTGQNGYHVVDKEGRIIAHHPVFPLTDGTTLSNDITGIAINRESGDIWIGLLFEGIAYHSPYFNQFGTVKVGSDHTDGIGNSINAIMNMDGRNLLLASTGGLYVYDRESGSVSRHPSELGVKTCLTLYRDRSGRVWVGTLYDGLYLLDGNRVARRYHSPETEFHVFQRGLNVNTVRKIYEDSAGRHWVSVKGGLCRFYPETGTFEPLSDLHPELAPYQICTDIGEDENGQLVVASSSGLFYYNAEKDFVWRPEVDAPRDKRYLHRNSHYTSLLRDRRGLWWFGMQNGLNIVDMKTNEVWYLDSEYGLTNSVIKSMTEDDDGNVWVATANGINSVRVSAAGNGYAFDVVAYDSHDGLLKGEYYTTSSYKSADGQIYLGGRDGISMFAPGNVNYGEPSHRPIITGLRLFNTPVKVGKEYSGRVILGENPAYTESVELNHHENFITIEFSGLNFNNPLQTSYRYKLEGMDPDWTEISGTSQPQAVYTDLPPGEYTFRVQSANESREWGDEYAELKVKIRPPFWKTTLACLIYVFLVLGALGCAGWWSVRRGRQKILEDMEKERARQQEELSQMKFKFFTNISHELRTPLTLIITPLESYINKMNEGEDKRRLSSISRHAHELLQLVNQLLDFRKLEMKGETVNLQHGDIAEFVDQSVIGFEDMAREKEIELNCDIKVGESMYAYFDRNKMQKILNNLLSNAFKFTPAGGSVDVSISRKDVEGRNFILIKVADSGIGIPAKDLEHIFDRFYQTESSRVGTTTGTGIGLHMIKEYAALHDGKVTVESQEGKGTTFTVMIPSDLRPAGSGTAALATDIDAETLSEATSSDGEGPREKQNLLIVEDNDEFRAFLKEELIGDYNVETAVDGVEGLEKSMETNPDIIISDIMMPRKDGIELCKEIKTDVRTSHIPVVLLTARASDEGQMQGFEAGADAYVSKPFNMDLLRVRIRHLIDRRRERQETFRKEIAVEPERVTITAVDEQFVQKALECVEKNMDNSEYSVDDMSEDLGTSRQTLYRKMQAIVGQTPKDFIRTIRLKRAAQLLTDSDMPISEIAYMVGFTTPRYFARVFKDHFGMIPSQYGKRTDEKEDGV